MRSQNQQGIGRWSALFGESASFQDEIKHALKIKSEWLVDDDEQVDIVLDHIPGWLPPLWGIAQEKLYIRRPEGVWWTHVPKLSPNATMVLHQRRVSDNEPIGSLVLGEGQSGCEGWIEGRARISKLRAADMDMRHRPNDKYGSEIDEFVRFGDDIEWNAGRLVVDGGDYFDKPPRFRVDNDRLVAIDKTSGHTVAYEIVPSPSLRSALAERRLWLRFESAWLDGFEARVEYDDVWDA